MAIDKRAGQQHDNRVSLFDLIIGALEQAGKNIGNLTSDDLAPGDEFHTRGRPATSELAKLVGFGGS